MLGPDDPAVVPAWVAGDVPWAPPAEVLGPVCVLGEAVTVEDAAAEVVATDGVADTPPVLGAAVDGDALPAPVWGPLTGDAETGAEAAVDAAADTGPVVTGPAETGADATGATVTPPAEFRPAVMGPPPTGPPPLAAAPAVTVAGPAAVAEPADVAGPAVADPARPLAL